MSEKWTGGLLQEREKERYRSTSSGFANFPTRSPTFMREKGQATSAGYAVCHNAVKCVFCYRMEVPVW